MSEESIESTAVVNQEAEVEVEVAVESESVEIIESKKSSLIELFSAMFVKENYDANSYIQAHVIPGTQTIPMSAIFQSPEILRVTANEKTIRHALLESKGIIFTEDGLKLIVRPEQNTVILRDISSKTTSEEIFKIFNPDPTDERVDGADEEETAVPDACPLAQSVRSDMNDTWFVTFLSESDARAALHALKSRRFNGVVIKARLKTETLNKSFFSAKLNSQGPYSNQNLGPGSMGGANYGQGNDRSGNNRMHNRQGNNNSDRQEEFFNGSGVPPDYMSAPHNGAPNMPGMYFGSYPVPPPPAYMGMGLGPMNLPNMQMITSYPIVMNTHTGRMQWAPNPSNGHNIGPMMMSPNITHPGSMGSHSQGGNGTPPQHQNRPRTRSCPQTPREVASSHGPSGTYKNNRQRVMSFGGGPMTNGSGLDFFPPQYALHDGTNMQYGYQNVGYPNNVNFVQQGGPMPRPNRNGNSKYQNQFTNSPQSNNAQGQNQGNQNNKKHGTQNYSYQNSGSENSNLKKNHEHGNNRAEDSESMDPSDGIEPNAFGDNAVGGSDAPHSGRANRGDQGEGKSRKAVRLHVATGLSTQSSMDNEGDNARCIDLGVRSDDTHRKTHHKGKGFGGGIGHNDGKDGEDGVREGRERQYSKDRDREPRERGEHRERGEGRDGDREPRERGEGRERREGRNRERVIVPKHAPQPDFNMDSDFPTLVEGDSTEGCPQNSASLAGGIIGYAAAAKRGVQDTDSDISPTAASSSTSSHFNEKGGAKRPPIKKSLSHESGTRTLTSSLVTSSAMVSAMSGLDSHKMPSIPLQISPTTVTARSSPSIPIPASSTTVSNGAPTTPVRVSTTATDSSGEKGLSKADVAKSHAVDNSPDAIIFGDFKAPAALVDVRALHFGPSLSTNRTSVPPVTIPIALKPAYVKSDTAAQQSSSTSTTSVATPQESHGTPILVPTDSKQIAPHPVLVPVPVPPPASVSTGTTNTPGPGTPIPEIALPHTAPLSGSDAPGSVWGAKRSFLDVVKTSK